MNNTLEIRGTRNSIVYEDGRFWRRSKADYLRHLVKILPGLHANSDHIELSRECTLLALQRIERFLVDLYDEAQLACGKTLAEASLEPV